MKNYSRKELIERLDLDGMCSLKYEDDIIQATEEDIVLFKSELNEAIMMTLEEYSPKAYRIYKFLFK